TAPAAAAAEAEEVAQDVGEIGEDGGIEAAAPHPRHALVAEAIVAGALVAVGEHLVGFRGLLEVLLGGAVARVAVGVILDRQPPVGRLELHRADGAFDAQHLVIVTLCHMPGESTMPGGRRESSPVNPWPGPAGGP